MRGQLARRGATPTSIEIGRISSELRPSGRFLWTAIRSRMSVFSSLSSACDASIRRTVPERERMTIESVIALISLAYLEEDGLLLSIALLAGVARADDGFALVVGA